MLAIDLMLGQTVDVKLQSPLVTSIVELLLVEMDRFFPGFEPRLGQARTQRTLSDEPNSSWAYSD